MKPLADATAFRLTLNTMHDPSRVAATIAIGSSATPRPFPYGANATRAGAAVPHRPRRRAPTCATRSPARRRRRRADGQRRPRAPPDQVRVPHARVGPGRGTVRLAAGVGLWDAAAGRYLVPGRRAPRRHARAARAPPPRRPRSSTSPSAAPSRCPTSRDPGATGRRPGAGGATARRATRCAPATSPRSTPTSTSASSPTATDDEQRRPRRPARRTASSPAATSRAGRRLRQLVRRASSGCEGELRGRLQPYALYVPEQAAGRRALRADAAAALARRELQPVLRQRATSRSSATAAGGALVITPSGPRARTAGTTTTPARTRSRCGPTSRAATRSTRRARRSPATRWAATARTSSPTQFPDLFAPRAADRRAARPRRLGAPDPPQPGGDQSLTFRQLASLRNIPFLIWDARQRRARPDAGPGRAGPGLRRPRLPLRVRLVRAGRAPHARRGRPVRARRGVPRRRARWTATRAHVTYVRNPTMDFPTDGTKPTTRTGCRRSACATARAAPLGNGRRPLARLRHAAIRRPRQRRAAAARLDGGNVRLARLHLPEARLGSGAAHRARGHAATSAWPTSPSSRSTRDRARLTCGAACGSSPTAQSW